MTLRTLKEPPHSHRAETIILGMLMVWRPDCSWTPDDLAAVIVPEDFYRDAHGLLYAFLLERYSRDMPLEMVAVVEDLALLPDQGRAYGGLSYVSTLPDQLPSSENPLHYAKIILGCSENRQAIQVLREEHDGLVTGRKSRADVLERMEQFASDAGRARAGTAPRPVGELVGSSYARIQREAAGRGGRYITTGIEALDYTPGVAGLSTVGLTMVIANVGIGKTMFLNAMSIGLARAGYRVGLYGTETTYDERVTDLAFAMAGVNQLVWAERCAERAQQLDAGQPMRFGDWIDEQMAKLETAYHELSQLPLEVFPSGWTVEQICGTVRRMRRQGAIDVFVLDYLQDICHSPGFDLGMTWQTTHKSKMLKDTQAKVSIPFVVAAQAKHFDQHPTEKGDNSFLIPQGRTIQNSSQVHKDGNEVWALHRHDYWAGRYPDVADANNIPGYEGNLTVAFRKRRVGGELTCHLPCDITTKWVGER